jgi:anion-transporting  ArsA/GET3 family ATPase
VEALIADAERTLLLPVALAEELPARETAELVERVRGELSIHVDRVVVNAVHPSPFPEGLDDLDRRLAALPPELGFETLPAPPLLASCAAHLSARHALNRRYVREIARTTRLPVISLPYLRRGIDGVQAVDALATRLAGPPEAL